jgi:hypothetical protein
MIKRNSYMHFLFWLAAGSIALAASCKKPEIKKPGDTKQGITLDFYSFFDDQAIVYKTGEYTRSNGEVARFTNIAMILSKVSLVRTDDVPVMLGDGYLFVDFAGNKTSFNFPAAPAGDYKAITFQLGLDSAINHGDPTLWPSDHALNANYTGLHWGWATGYIFQAIDGGYKKQASDTDWNGISLHTATDKFPKQHSIPFNFTLASNAVKIAKINVAVDEFFENPTFLSFATDGSFSHSVGATEIALMQKIMDNSGDVFDIAEVK